MDKIQEKKLIEMYFNRQATVEDFIKLTAMKCCVCTKFICWMLEAVQDEAIGENNNRPLS
jgi:hypothetical protein